MGIINSVWPFRSDSHRRFEKLVRPHLKQLYNLAYHFTGQQHDAEDLVQDLLLKLYPRLDEMLVIEKLRPWLSRILYRQYIDLYRRQQRSPISFMNEDEEIIYETHANDTAGPAELVNAELTQGILNDALNKLNDDQRVLVILHDIEGYSLHEINNMIDVPVGTLKSRLSRARAKLRKIISLMEPNVAEGRVSTITE